MELRIGIASVAAVAPVVATGVCAPTATLAVSGVWCRVSLTARPDGSLGHRSWRGNASTIEHPAGEVAKTAAMSLTRRRGRQSGN